MTNKNRRMEAPAPRRRFHTLITTRSRLSPEPALTSGSMPNVRNPIFSLLLTMTMAAGLSLLLAIPVVLFPLLGLPYFELQVFCLAFAAFGVGMIAGRASFLGSMGFAGALIGGLAGFPLFPLVFPPVRWLLS